MVNYEEDYEWGQSQEKKIFPILEKKWKGLIQQRRYDPYDVISNEVNMEIKSRKGLRMNSYSKTLLTANKIRDTSKPNIFIFNFVFDMVRDKREIYYIEYDEEKFNKYERKMFSRAKKESDEKDYIYIPIEDLILLYKDEEDPPKCLLLFKPKRQLVEAN
jgi:hypothetical protein